MYTNFHTFTPNMTSNKSCNPQETRFSTSQLQRFRLSASSQGESHRCSVCRKPAILDYVYVAPIPGLGAPFWKFSGVEGCAWTAQVAIKRSRLIEANTLTSTYQSPCLAIKQLPTVEKPPPCSIPRRRVTVVGGAPSGGARGRRLAAK